MFGSEPRLPGHFVRQLLGTFFGCLCALARRSPGSPWPSQGTAQPGQFWWNLGVGTSAPRAFVRQLLVPSSAAFAHLRRSPWPSQRMLSPGTRARGSLASLVSDFGALEGAALRKASTGIAQGLDYLHTRSPPVVHRDLKVVAGLRLSRLCRHATFGCTLFLPEVLWSARCGTLPIGRGSSQFLAGFDRIGAGVDEV